MISRRPVRVAMPLGRCGPAGRFREAGPAGPTAAPRASASAGAVLQSQVGRAKAGSAG